MFIAPPLLFVLFIHSCFDPPLFSLGCSARGSIKPVIASLGGERWAWGVGNSFTESKHCTWGWFLLGKGQEEGMGKKYEIYLRPRVSFSLNKLLQLKIKIGWKRGGFSEGSWRVRMGIQQHGQCRSDSPGWGGIAVSSLGSRGRVQT